MRAARKQKFHFRGSRVPAPGSEVKNASLGSRLASNYVQLAMPTMYLSAIIAVVLLGLINKFQV